MLVALGSFCLPILQIPCVSTAGVQRDCQEFTRNAKLNPCVLAKTSTKVSVRKSTAQPLVQLSLNSGTFRHAALISLHVHFARFKIIRVSLAEASRFANVVHQSKVTSGLTALVTRPRHRIAGVYTIAFTILAGISVGIYSSILVTSRFVRC